MRVYVNGTYIYLGIWGSPEANQEYHRIVAEMLTPGGQAGGFVGSAIGAAAVEFAVNDVVAAFLQWAKVNYRHTNGESTGSFERYVIIVRPLVLLYGNSPVSKFGPLTLKAVREDMVRSGLARNTINTRITLIKTLFKWGVENEMVPVAVHQALSTVRGLAEGKTTAPDRPPVPQVKPEIIAKTLPHCHKTLQDMIRVQLHGAMRPGEICQMRPCDIDTSDDIWVYMPHTHKTMHKGKFRTIAIDPAPRAILMPYLIELENSPESYVFSPKAAVEMIKIERRQNRKTLPRKRTIKRKRNPQRKPGECYTHRSYRLAVKRAAAKAGVPHWSPNQLRHTRATEVEQALNIEAAQVMLGHTSKKTTEIYLDPEAKLKQQIEAAKEVARKISQHSSK